MGSDAATPSPRWRMHRQEETNRFAKDFQIQAYEELLPSLGQDPTSTATPAQAAAAWTRRPNHSPEGVAT
jgi:O-methyltransferase involved in polyketide biosynthesis